MTTKELQTFLQKQQERYPIPAYNEPLWVTLLTWIAILLPLALAILGLLFVTIK